jgi:lysophospholipase L1-like esterase
MDKQLVIERLKQQCTIVVLGDSISRGVIFDEEKQRHSLLPENFANLVREHLHGIVYMAAKFGSTIVDGFQRLQTDVVTRKPDIVLIEFGGNDCDFQWKEIAENPSGSYHPNTECSAFYASLLEMVEYLRSLDIIPVLVSLPPLDAERYFRWVSNNSEMAMENILKFIGNVSHIYAWHERYNAAILRVAEETKTRLIDIRSAFLQREQYTDLICRDGIHPNKEGHKVIADKILEYIQRNYMFLLNNQPHTTTVR